MIDTQGLASLGDDVAAAAELYAARGFRVVPDHSVDGGVCSCPKGADCGRSAGKHPRIAKWTTEASSDPARIAKWWKAWPRTNVALAMGGADRLLALDVDGAAGRASLADLLAAIHVELPRTLTSRSGRDDGGEHLVFRVPDDLDLAAIPNAVGKAGKLGAGLDVRADGAKISVAPSLHLTGRRYAWIDESPIAELPRALYDLIVERLAPPPPLAPAVITGDVGDVVKRAAGYLAKLEPSIQGSNGSAALCAAAVALVRGFALDDGQALALLADEFNPRCQPAWTTKELEHAVRNVARKSKSAVGYLLDDPKRRLERQHPKAPAELPPEAVEREPDPDEQPPPDDDAKGNVDPTTDWRLKLKYRELKGGEKGPLVACGANAMLILSHDEAWEGVLSWNEFTSTMTTTRVPPWDACDAPARAEVGTWSDADTTRAQAWLMRHYDINVGAETVIAAAMAAAERRAVHPVREWIETLNWDGQKRIETWLTRYLGVAAGKYASRVGRWFLVSSIARLYKPGTLEGKVDTMIVLEGDQGIGKSTALRVLFDPWFSDTPLDLSSKDRFVGLRGVWCYEFAELDSFGKADVARVKSFLSSQVDDYRPPYGRANVKVKRQCVFAGSVNPTGEYLRDESGNRRFWPVKCAEVSRVDLEALKRDREQLIAEAREMYLSGEKWWPDSAEVALVMEQQQARAATDAWDPLVAAWLYGDPRRALEGVTVGAVLEYALKLDTSRWGQVEQNRASRSLRAAGWQRVQRRVGTGHLSERRREWVYLPPTAAAEPAPEPSKSLLDDIFGSEAAA